MDATNFGNVRLSNFSLSGDVINCSARAGSVMPPGSSIRCILRKNVTAEQLSTAESLLLSFPMSVSPLGTVTALQNPPWQTYLANLSALIGASPACTNCQGCLASAGAFTKQNFKEPNSTVLAKSFRAYCLQSDLLKATQLCGTVADAISGSTFGNLGRRAAGLCFALRLCDRRLGTSCSSGVALDASQVAASTATLDTCTGEHCCALSIKLDAVSAAAILQALLSSVNVLSKFNIQLSPCQLKLLRLMTFIRCLNKTC